MSLFEATLAFVSLRSVMIGGPILLLFFLAAWWELSRSAWWRALRASRPSPRRLFDELARAHRLNPSERSACREVAADSGLSEAAELFVRPEKREALARRSVSLADHLFGDLDTAADPGGDHGEKR